MKSYKTFCFISKTIFILTFVACHSMPVDDQSIASSHKDDQNLSLSPLTENKPQPEVAKDIKTPPLVIGDGKVSKDTAPKTKPADATEFNNGAQSMLGKKPVSGDIGLKESSYLSKDIKNELQNSDASKLIDSSLTADKLPPIESLPNVNQSVSSDTKMDTSKLPKKMDSADTSVQNTLKSNASDQSSITKLSKDPQKSSSKMQVAVTAVAKETSEVKSSVVTQSTEENQEASVKENVNDKPIGFSDLDQSYSDADVDKDNSEVNRKTDDIEIDQIPNQVNNIPKDNTIVLQDKASEINDDANSHFFAYFLTMMVMVVLFYLLFHNKQRILALMIEGRGGRQGRRGARAKYHKLDNNLEEAMSSSRGHGDGLGRIY